MSERWQRHGTAFSAHDCDPFLPGQLHQFLKVFLKFRRLHVIGITIVIGFYLPADDLDFFPRLSCLSR